MGRTHLQTGDDARRILCMFVFIALTDPRQPFSVERLGGQARDMKRKSNFHAGADLDVFVLNRMASHS
jgi:hypothetical protein